MLCDIFCPESIFSHLLSRGVRRRWMMRALHLFLIAASLLCGCESLFSQPATNSPYEQVVTRIYLRAWVLPDGATNTSNIPVASVVIAKDGRVISAKLVKPSRNRQLDKSVQQALKRVTAVHPFESSSKEERRVFTIRFDRRAIPREAPNERSGVDAGIPLMVTVGRSWPGATHRGRSAAPDNPRESGGQ
jgi:TonB family protein